MSPRDSAAASRSGRSYIGADVLRVEDAPLLTGRARFVDDLSLPNMAHAAFVRSPHPHVRLDELDLAPALATPGVIAAFSGDDLADICRPWTLSLGHPGVVEASRTVLPLSRARFMGEAVAVVVAESRYAAEDACEAVSVGGEILDVVVDPEAALDPEAPLVDESLDSNDMGCIEFSGGDPEGAFARAPHVFSLRFTMGRHAGMPIETRGVLAEFDRAAQRLRVWSSTQVPHKLRAMLAECLDLRFAAIRVIAPAVGGGFGLKASVYPEEAVVPAISGLIGRPVKWIEDRFEELAASSHSKEVVCDVEVAVEVDGTLTGLRASYLGNGGAYPNNPYTAFADTIASANMSCGVYRLEHVRARARATLTNKCEVGTTRGIGWVPGLASRELLIDHAAAELSKDPLDLRLHNCISAEPGLTAFGQQYGAGSYSECLTRAAELLDYRANRAAQESLRADGRLVGVSVIPFVEPTGFGARASKVLTGSESPLFDGGQISIDPDGSVIVRSSLHSHGQSHETTMAQVVAEHLGVSLDRIRYVQGDTESIPYGAGTWGSRSAVVGSGALRRAAEDVAGQVRELAAAMLEADPGDIVLSGDRAFVTGSPDQGVALPEVAHFAYYGDEARPARFRVGGGLSSAESYEPPEIYTNGAIGALLEIDAETGAVDLQTIAAVIDCGTMINPVVVKGQITGGIMFGIGAALLEEIAYSEDGQLVTASLIDYLYPTSAEVGSILVDHIQTPSSAKGGVKGVGESGTIATPAAIVTAVADALRPVGAAVPQTPMTPDRIRAALVSAGHV